MNLLERVLTLLRANLNSMMEKSDDPEKILKQLQQDMRNQLVQVKTEVATAIAQAYKLQSRGKEKQVEAEAWLKKAEQAIQKNNDDAARAALSRYNESLKQARHYQQQTKESEQLVTTMRNILRQLESKISEVEMKLESLLTHKRNALIQQRVYDALSKNNTHGDYDPSQRANDVIQAEEALARALADLQQHNLDAQLETLSREQMLENQLRDLKAKGKNTPQRETPLLHEANPQPAPLLPPRPQAGTSAKRPTPENNAQAEIHPTAETLSTTRQERKQLKKLLEN